MKTLESFLQTAQRNTKNAVYSRSAAAVSFVSAHPGGRESHFRVFLCRTQNRSSVLEVPDTFIHAFDLVFVTNKETLNAVFSGKNPS